MKEIVIPLLNWYQKNKRELPWRIDKNPYHVWISEIMLQQTRIEAVKDYYQKFIIALPTIQDLANVDEDNLLKLWQGLGYYNRARNLQKAAQIIMSKYDGTFPNQYEQVLSLPGIGEYTAGAIGSICYSIKQPAIDGNVLRVMMRLQNSYDNIDAIATKNKVKNQLLEIMPENSGDFNEAIMELGETICLPNTMPNCDACPLASLCLVNKFKTQSAIPVREEKKPKTIEHYTVLLFIHKNKIAITKRQEKGVLQNLWQFPNIENIQTEEMLINWLDEHTIKVDKIILGNNYQHVFTHKIWKNQIYIIYVKNCISQYTWVTLEQLEKEFAIPTAFLPVLNEYKNLSNQTHENMI